MELLNLSAYHANNKRALPLPLSTFALECAIGDMRRLAALLHFFLKGLEKCTIFSDMLSDIHADPLGAKAFSNASEVFERRCARVQRLAEAVKIMRHITSLRMRGLNPGRLEHFARVEACVAAEISRAGAVTSNDLSFNE